MKRKFDPFRKRPKLNFIFWFDVFAERYGWTYDEIRELPIPVFFALQKEIAKKIEEQNKGRK